MWQYWKRIQHWPIYNWQRHRPREHLVWNCRIWWCWLGNAHNYASTHARRMVRLDLQLFWCKWSCDVCDILRWYCFARCILCNESCAWLNHGLIRRIIWNKKGRETESSWNRRRSIGWGPQRETKEYEKGLACCYSWDCRKWKSTPNINSSHKVWSWGTSTNYHKRQECKLSCSQNGRAWR